MNPRWHTGPRTGHIAFGDGVPDATRHRLRRRSEHSGRPGTAEQVRDGLGEPDRAEVDDRIVARTRIDDRRVASEDLDVADPRCAGRAVDVGELADDGREVLLVVGVGPGPEPGWIWRPRMKLGDPLAQARHPERRTESDEGPHVEWAGAVGRQQVIPDDRAHAVGEEQDRLPSGRDPLDLVANGGEDAVADRLVAEVFVEILHEPGEERPAHMEHVVEPADDLRETVPVEALLVRLRCRRQHLLRDAQGQGARPLLERQGQVDLAALGAAIASTTLVARLGQLPTVRTPDVAVEREVNGDIRGMRVVDGLESVAQGILPGARHRRRDLECLIASVRDDDTHLGPPS